MKTLRKGDDFKRLKDSNLKDLKEINSYLKLGWKYCSKSEYRKFYGIEKPVEKKAEKVEEDTTIKKEKKSKKNG